MCPKPSINSIDLFMDGHEPATIDNAFNGPNAGFCHGSVCGLCGEKCLKFDPPILSCDSCAARIRRGDTFYRSADGHRWCVKCVNSGTSTVASSALVP